MARRAAGGWRSATATHERDWQTRASVPGLDPGIELRIPTLRRGSYFPGFLEPRRMAEKALTAVIQEAYVKAEGCRKVLGATAQRFGGAGAGA